VKQPISSRQREAQFRRERRDRKPDAAATLAGTDGRPSEGAPAPKDKQERRKYLRE
jgi:hypothetical protein